MNDIKIKSTRATAGVNYEEYLHGGCFMYEALSDCGYHEYGNLCDRVKNQSGEYNLADLRVKTWSFEVPDTKDGVMTVARALGHGMADLSPMYDDDDLRIALNDAYGIRLKKVQHHEGDQASYEQTMICKKPVLIISPDTIGYRCVWGSVLETYGASASTDPEEAEGEDWSVDFYELHPGMKDGGCLVQSGSSSATVMAEKSGDTWTVTLTLPMLDSGKIIGRSYESAFRGAYKWYCNLAG